MKNFSICTAFRRQLIFMGCGPRRMKFGFFQILAVFVLAMGALSANAGMTFPIQNLGYSGSGALPSRGSDPLSAANYECVSGQYLGFGLTGAIPSSITPTGGGAVANTQFNFRCAGAGGVSTGWMGVVNQIVCPSNSTAYNATPPYCNCSSGYQVDPTQSSCSSTANGATVADNYQDDPYCEECNKAAGGKTESHMGNPISYLLGAKKESIPTGFSVGSTPLNLNYDTNKYFVSFAAGLNFKTLGTIPSAGGLWETSLHKSLHTNVGGFGVHIFRGNTRAISFKYNGTAFVADADINDSLSFNSTTQTYTYVNVKSQIVETYNKAGQITSETDGSGNTLTYAYSTAAGADAPAAGYLISATDNVGRFIAFTYSLPTGGVAATDGLISKITNAAGQVITLGYDANQNLTTVTWPDSKVYTFLYENTSFPWALTGKVDERGIRFATFSYDANGRAISTQLAGGVDSYSVSYTTPPQINVATSYNATTGVTTRTHAWTPPTGVTVTTPNGQNSLVSASSYMGFNRLTAASQPAGSGCGSASNAVTYDANGNVASEDDFLGVRTCYAFDSQNRQITRVEGLSNTVACSSVIPAGSTLPSGVRKFTTKYHPDWRVPTVATGPGAVNTAVYQGQPDPFNANVAANCTAAPALPNGKVLPVVCKTVTQVTMDTASPAVQAQYGDPYQLNVVMLLHADGANGSTAIIDSSSKAYALSPSKCGPCGNTTTSGAPTITTAQSKFGGSSLTFNGTTANTVMTSANSDFAISNAPMTIELWAYPTAFNANGGHMLAAGGGTLAWNSSNGIHWHMQTQGTNQIGFGFWDGATSVKGLAGVANLNAWNHIAISYDGTSMRMFVNGVMTGSLVTTMPAPSALPQMALGIIPGEGYAATNGYSGYLDEIRITKGVARYTAAFTPPAAPFYTPGATILDPIAQNVVNTFTYDAAGRVLTSTDTLNRTTNYAYYAATSLTGTAPNQTGHTIGDLASITDPAGMVTTFDLYDQLGRILQTTDPKGVVTQISYTPRGWVNVVRTMAPGLPARVSSYAYDAVGQITGVTTPDGATVSFAYDAAHRLIGATDNKGNTVTYTLDNLGNRISEQITDPSGTLQRSINRSFDALNRLQQVTGAAK